MINYIITGFAFETGVLVGVWTVVFLLGRQNDD